MSQQMNFEQQTRQAKDPRDALLAIARGLDAVLAALGSKTPSDGWGEWGGGLAAEGASAERAATPTPAEDFYAVKQAPLDHEAIDRAAAAIERYQQLVDRSPTPANLALLESAQRSLAKASEPGEYLDNSGAIVGDSELIPIEEAADGDIVDLSMFRGDAKRWAMRRQLAEAIDLPSYFPPIMRSNAATCEEILHSYEMAGPMWLYQNRIIGDHDIFAQLPTEALRVMTVDIQQDSPRVAWEFQRDVMKGEDAEGATLSVAQDNINSAGGRASVPLRGQN